MVIWDLADAANETHDKFDRATTPLYGSIFEAMPKIGLLRNRGVLYSDFVDFLDGFRCHVDPANPAKRDSDLRELLNERKFPYDFAADICGS